MSGIWVVPGLGSPLWFLSRSHTIGIISTRALAHDLLAKAAAWWEPGYVKTLLHGKERPLEPIYFRISIDELSGHQARPVA